MYQTIEKGSIAGKQNRTKEDVEIDRHAEEFTLKPTINQDGAHLSATDVDMSEIKGFDLKMDQIKEGRKIKEANKKATERGIPLSKKRPPTV